MIWKEDWKDISGFADYQVSNMGRVRSRKKQYHPRILKLGKHYDGRLQVVFTMNGSRHTKKVHRLVTEAFIPRKPQVNHLNGIKQDNRVCNLKWCTDAENKQHAREMKRKRRNILYRIFVVRYHNISWKLNVFIIQLITRQ